MPYSFPDTESFRHPLSLLGTRDLPSTGNDKTITRPFSPLSLFNGSEVAVKRFLPNSHLSTVIIRDNTSVQRIQEIKVNHLEETRIKRSHFYEHLKKKFLSDQQKKISRWKKETNRFLGMLAQAP
uniref:Uncharacterized protein n=1 Tax=Gopherus evgoodei TaxID=1825980 RepID=A0A8C4YIJ3_9SAUR